MNFRLQEAILLCIIESLILKVQCLIGRTQSVGVRGQLLCKGQPAAGVRVKLYDDDSGPDLDDFLDAGYTDAEGNFHLSGTADEITTIDPKLNIYHDCDDWLPCQRRISVMIPSRYVSLGTVIHEYYNAGKIELQGEWKGETRDCIHRN